MSTVGDWAVAVGMTVVVTTFWLTSTPWWQMWTELLTGVRDDDQP